jgi:hypothetical protein
MVHRKAELSKRRIDCDWPHQVTLPSRLCIGDNYHAPLFLPRSDSL